MNTEHFTLSQSCLSYGLGVGQRNNAAELSTQIFKQVKFQVSNWILRGIFL